MTLDAIQQGAKQLVELIYSYETKKEKSVAQNALKILESIRKQVEEEKHE